MVIAIIAILALILLPIIGSVRQRGYATKSLSNKRVIYTAFSLYHAENGKFPDLIDVEESGSSSAWDTKTGWSGTMAPYLDFIAYPDPNNKNVMKATEVLYCPAQEDHNDRRGDYGVAYNETYGPFRTYRKDKATGKTSENYVGSYSLEQIIDPGTTPFIADCQQYGVGTTLVGSWFFDPRLTAYKPPSGSNPVLCFRHNGKVQMVFADGSSDSYTVDELFGNILPWKNQ